MPLENGDAGRSPAQPSRTSRATAASATSGADGSPPALAARSTASARAVATAPAACQRPAPPPRPTPHAVLVAQCSFYEYRGYKVVYRRYASLFFIMGVEGEDEVHTRPHT